MMDEQMNIEQEIKELKNKLAELERQVKEKKITRRYIPKYLENYFYVNSQGFIISELNNQYNVDKYRISIGNGFKTEAEAEKHNRILVNTQKLKDLAEKLNDGVEIDWENDTQLKYYIRLDLSKGRLFIGSTHFYKSQCSAYSLNMNFLTKAIEEIGEENLIELIKG